MNHEYGINTKLIHAGELSSPDALPLIPPIYQTSTFVMDELLASGIKRGKYVYSRLSNPTLTALELKMATLEGGDAAVSFASGMGAISAIVLALLRCGDHVVCDQVLYGSTYQLLKNGASRLGFEVSFVDASKPDNVDKALRDNTKFVFFETPANPTLKLVDIAKVAAIATENDVKTVVDNTFLTPYYQKPLELGADIVVHSATKYLNGHGDALGGILVCSYEDAVNIRKGVLRHVGAALSPFNAFLIMRGLRTLGVRMERHTTNATEIASFLKAQKLVKRVLYPSFDRQIKRNPDLKTQMSGYGGMLAFEIHGGLEAAVAFLNNLKLCKVAVSLGDTSTLIEHPGLMTHSALSKEEKDKLGITDNLVRVSVGLEDVEDIEADIEQALHGV